VKAITQTFLRPMTLMMSTECWLFALRAHKDDIPLWEERAMRSVAALKASRRGSSRRPYGLSRRISEMIQAKEHQ